MTKTPVGKMVLMVAWLGLLGLAGDWPGVAAPLLAAEPASAKLTRPVLFHTPEADKIAVSGAMMVAGVLTGRSIITRKMANWTKTVPSRSIRGGDASAAASRGRTDM